MPITVFWCKFEFYVIFVRGFIEDFLVRFCALFLPSDYISLPATIAFVGGLSTIAHLVMARGERSSERMLRLVIKRFGSTDMIIRQMISMLYIANIAVSSRTHYVHLSINDLSEVALQSKIELL